MAERKYQKPRKRNIDKKKVSEFLNSINFEVEFISQEWRHLTAFGKYQNKDAVFKLASTLVTSKRTRNEFWWNNAVNKIPTKNFVVPQNFDSGYYGKLFYLIEQRFLGEALIRRDSTDPSRVAPRIKQITLVTKEIEELKITSNKKSQYKAGENLFESSVEWAKQVPLDLDLFLKVIQKAKDSLRTAPAHGDFVPRQMFHVNGKIGLIDGEFAGVNGPLYLDAAQFYLRLRVDSDSKDIAKEYLIIFKDILDPPDRDIFWEELKPVLIQRYIGDLWGAAKNSKKLKELKPLGEEILRDKII